MKCRIIVLDTEYHGQADSRITVMCALEDKLRGATRDWHTGLSDGARGVV